MKIVIDSNRIAAALLKDSTTRGILFNNRFDFVAPEFVKEEIAGHRAEFVRKAGISSGEFDILLSLIFGSVTLIPKAEYSKFAEKLKYEISDIKFQILRMFLIWPAALHPILEAFGLMTPISGSRIRQRYSQTLIC